MNKTIVRPPAWLPAAATAALLAAAGAAAQAQDAGGSAGATAGAGASAEPGATAALAGATPWYVGASQSLTHDSNVYRVPSGPGDNYSSTSLLGGFDQRISRQRVFGNANVGLNRYDDQTRLNNTSYNVAGGLDWETVHQLSGNLHLALGQSLAAPGLGSAAPEAERNIARTRSVDGRVRWGGQSLLTLEASAGYNKIDYSGQTYAASNSRQTTGSLAAYWRPGSALRLGVAGRVVDNEAPQAFLDPVSGSYQSNTARSRNLDLLADYTLSGLLSANARLSYTHQTNSNIEGAGFSGVTGGFGVAWQPTGKTSLQLNFARDAGFDANRFATYSVAPDGSGGVQIVPSIGQYENSRISNSANLRVNYAATAKISAYAGASYVRARLNDTIIDSSGNQAGPESTDTLRTAYLGADYAVARNWLIACKVYHEHRRVSGGSFGYAYGDDTVNCSVRYQVQP